MKTDFKQYPAAALRRASTLSRLGRGVGRALRAGFAEPRCLPPRFGEGEGPGRLFGLLVPFDHSARR